MKTELRREIHVVDENESAGSAEQSAEEAAPMNRPLRSMDIVRDKREKPLLRKYWYVLVALGVIAALAGIKMYLGNASYIVPRDDLKVSVVQKGAFAVDVRANGQLKSKDVFLLASRVSGSVGQILIKAGDTVEVDTPVVNLVNPQLTIDLNQAQAKLQQTSAESQVEMRTLGTALLDHQIQLLTAKNNYQNALRELNAKTELSKFDGGLVSAMDLQQAKASVETQQQIWHFSEKRVDEMRERVAAQKRAQELQIQQLRAAVANIQTQIDQLVVRAGMRGTLQSLAVSPGQKLNVGDSVGVVADTTMLIAQLQVPELQVQQVRAGLPVTIDTRRSKIEGKVIRVAPSVAGGMVEVDVALDGAVPAEARADLSVEGLVHVVELQNVTFIDRPDFAKANTVGTLYRLNGDESKASKIPVKFGEASVNQIQIVSGAAPGDRIITSDVSSFAAHDTIIVK
jgi:HlyD family secretion protein